MILHYIVIWFRHCYVSSAEPITMLCGHLTLPCTLSWKCSLKLCSFPYCHICPRGCSASLTVCVESPSRTDIERSSSTRAFWGRHTSRNCKECVGPQDLGGGHRALLRKAGSCTSHKICLIGCKYKPCALESTEVAVDCCRWTEREKSGPELPENSRCTLWEGAFCQRLLGKRVSSGPALIYISISWQFLAFR